MGISGKGRDMNKLHNSPFETSSSMLQHRGGRLEIWMH